MTDERRPMETEMAVLWQRMDNVAALFDQLVTTLVGSPRGFTLMIHPKDDCYATLSVTNLAENVEAVRGWLRHMDERKEAGKPFDDPDAPQPGNLLTDHAAIQAAIARGETVHPGAMADPFENMPRRKKKRRAAHPTPPEPAPK